MKKPLLRTLAALMLAALLLCGPALAEAANSLNDGSSGETQTFTAADGSYTFEVPGDWHQLDADTALQMVQDMVNSGAISEEDMSATLQQAVAQAEAVDAFFYADDFTGNMNLMTGPAPVDDYSTVFEEMESALRAQYKDAGIDMGAVELVTYNGVNYIAAEISLMGSDMMQYLGATGGIGFVFTFTGLAMEGAETVLTTLSVGQ